MNKSEGKWDQLPTAETSVLVWLDKGLNTISFTESCRYNGPNIDKVEIHETDQTMENPTSKNPIPNRVRKSTNTKYHSWDPLSAMEQEQQTITDMPTCTPTC